MSELPIVRFVGSKTGAEVVAQLHQSSDWYNTADMAAILGIGSKALTQDILYKFSWGAIKYEASGQKRYFIPFSIPRMNLALDLVNVHS